MSYQLSNNNVSLWIDHPQENYQQARFDWTGKIVDLRYQGVSLCGIERETEGPNDFPGRGFYNEFGIEQAVGYEDSSPGDWFHKIGVGLLQKTEGPYDFAYPYKIKPLVFSVKETPDSLQLRCVGPLVNGYAYELEKIIRGNEHGFTIDYQLRNTGSKTIVTDEYAHNFLRIGEATVGAGYQLDFPFSLQPGVCGEVVNPKGIIAFQEQAIQLSDTPGEAFFYSFLNGTETVPAQWRLRNAELGLSIGETGSFQSAKVNLWGWSGAISPELFIPIQLGSGDSLRWQRKYEIDKAQ
ncbi:MAG TPA: hypothetical protein VJ953_22490 [Saprospiraceae bacterium]|nr:hypothetical protein [Saprospiraceae bacterium]